LIIYINSSINLLLIDHILKFGYYIFISYFIIYFHIELEPYYLLFIIIIINIIFIFYFIYLISSIKYY